MLKKYSIKKILISVSALVTLFFIYLVPVNDELNVIDKAVQELKYVDENLNINDIFLLDSNNYLGLTSIVVNSNDIESKVRELLDILISDGPGESKIPNGFKAILPSNTQILNIKYENGVVKVDFSKELLDINATYEEKVIEAIVYTLTSIDGVDKVIISVDGNILTKLPNTNTNIPSVLDRSFGINKEYDITSISDVNQINLYYVAKYSDTTYYVPVTKYVNDNTEKIRIVIDELSSSPIYNTNLISYLNSNTKLLAVENSEDALYLTFNSYIFSDIDERNILEEVIRTIELSIYDNYDVKEVIMKHENEEIYKSVIKTIE